MFPPPKRFTNIDSKTCLSSLPKEVMTSKFLIIFLVISSCVNSGSFAASSIKLCISLALAFMNLPSSLTDIPRDFAIPFLSKRLISSKERPCKSRVSLSIITRSDSVAFSNSTEFKNGPPNIAFKSPAAFAAPSKVSNCSPTMPVKEPTSMFRAREAPARRLNSVTIPGPNLAKESLAAEKPDIISSGGSLSALAVATNSLLICAALWVVIPRELIKNPIDSAVTPESTPS